MTTSRRSAPRLRLSLLLLGGCAAVTLGCTDSHPGRLGTDRSVRYSACTGTLIGYGTAQLHALVRPAAGTDCSALAGDCDTFLRCLGLDPDRPCEWPGEPRCDGDVVEYCDAATRLLLRSPCDDGTMCALDDSGLPQCRAAGAACESSRCEGDQRVSCINGLETRRTCTGVCVESDTGVFCADALETCESDRCEGSVRVRCRDGVAVTRSDCADRLRATTCSVDEGTAECVVPPSAAECEDQAAECVGSTGRICVEGTWIEFRCGDFLDGRCVQEDEGQLRCVVAD